MKLLSDRCALSDAECRDRYQGVFTAEHTGKYFVVGLTAASGLAGYPRPIPIRVKAVTPGTASPSDCVSVGGTRITVPDVVGKRLGPAIRDAQRAGLNVVGFGTVKTDPVDAESRVWAQKPEGDAKVPRGACVGFRTVDFSSSSVTVVALRSLTFDRKEYTVPAGKVTVHFTGATGLTLGFADPRFGKCLLTTDRGGPHACRVTLTPGSYRIYDTVPGHRSVELEATIVVPEPGR